MLTVLRDPLCYTRCFLSSCGGLRRRIEELTRPLRAVLLQLPPLCSLPREVGYLVESIENPSQFSPRFPHGTKIAEAVAPVSRIASRTLAKTGFPRCVSPAFLGFVPPTTLVPKARQTSFGVIHPEMREIP